MKLATYRNGTRDGHLMGVSRDLTKAVAIPAIASCMQELVDNWDELAPKADAVRIRRLPKAMSEPQWRNSGRRNRKSWKDMREPPRGWH